MLSRFKKIALFLCKYAWHVAALLFVFAIIYFVYRGWFNWEIIARGDWKARSAGWIKDWFDAPYAWDAGDFGGVPFANAGRIVRWPLYFLQAFLNQVFALPYSLTERIIWFFPFLLLAPVGIYLLTKELFKSRIAAFVSIFVFVFNNFVLFRAHGAQMGLLMCYALTPLVLFFFIRAFKKKFWVNILASSLVLVLIAYNDVRLATLVFAVMFFYSVYVYVSNRYFATESVHKPSSQQFVKACVSALVILFIFNAFWILPTFLSKQDVSFGGEAFSSLETVESLSRTSFLHTLSLSMGDDNKYGKFVYLPGQIDKRLLFVLPLLAGLPFLLFKRRRREAAFWTILWLALAFMAKGLNPPLAFLNRVFYDNFPLASMFRLPDKFLYIMATPFAMLYGVACAEIIEKAKDLKFTTGVKKLFYKFLVIGFFILAPLSVIFPALTGDSRLADTAGGSSFKSFVPPQYFAIEDWLNKQAPYYKTAWVQGTPVYDFFSFLHPRFEIRTGAQAQSLFGASYLNLFNYENPNNYLHVYKYLVSVKNFDKLMALVNIKYFMLPPKEDPDWAWQQDTLNDYLKVMTDNKNLNLKRIDIPDANLFENSIALPKVNAPHKSMIVVGGGKALEYLLARDDVKIKDWNFYFLENLNKDFSELQGKMDLMFFYNSGIEDLLLDSVENEFKVNGSMSANDYYKLLEAKGEIKVNLRSSVKQLADEEVKQLSFTKKIKNSGKYDVWARIAFSEASDNAVETIIDYQRQGVYYPDGNDFDQYRWIKVLDVDLAAGQHDFQLNFIAENFALDQVVVLPNSVYVQKEKELATYLSKTKSIFVRSFNGRNSLVNLKNILAIVARGKVVPVQEGNEKIDNIAEVGYSLNGVKRSFVNLLDAGNRLDSWQFAASDELIIEPDSEDVENQYLTAAHLNTITKILPTVTDFSQYSHVDVRLKESLAENMSLFVMDVNDRRCTFPIYSPDGQKWGQYEFSLKDCKLDQADALDWTQIKSVGFDGIYASYQLSWDYLYLMDKAGNMSASGSDGGDVSFWVKDVFGQEYDLEPKLFMLDVQDQVEIPYNADYHFLFDLKSGKTPVDLNRFVLNEKEWSLGPVENSDDLSIGPITLDGGSYHLESSFVDKLDYLTYSNFENSNLFAIQGGAAIDIVSWEMLNPSKYLVRAKVYHAGFIDLLDSYDPGWVASYDGKESSSTLLTTINNSFYIEPAFEGQEMKIYLEYRPQKLMDIGFMFFILGLVAILFLLLFGFKKKNNVIVAIIGPDGAGKSTYVETIRRKFIQDGIDFEVCYPFNYFLLRWVLNIFKSRKNHAKWKSVPEKRNTNFLFKFWPLIALLDNWLYYLSCLNKRNKVIICDRYFYDLATAFAEFGYTFNWLYKVYTSLLPKPDICFVLDADAKLLRKREIGDQHSLEFFVRQKARYSEIAEKYGFVLVNTDKQLRYCQARILSALDGKMIQGTAFRMPFRLPFKVRLPEIKSPVIFAAIFALLFWLLNLQVAILATFFAMFIFHRWNSRFMAAIAIFIFIIACLPIIFKPEFNYAHPSTPEDEFLIVFMDEAVIYAFYFLLINVILQIIEYRRDKDEPDMQKMKSKVKSKKSK